MRNCTRLTEKSKSVYPIKWSGYEYCTESEAVTLDENASLCPTVIGDCQNPDSVAALKHYFSDSTPAAIVFEGIPLDFSRGGVIDNLKNGFPGVPIIIVGIPQRNIYPTLANYEDTALFAARVKGKYRNTLIFENPPPPPSAAAAAAAASASAHDFDGSSLLTLRKDNPLLDNYLNKIGLSRDVTFEGLNKAVGQFFSGIVCKLLENDNAIDDRRVRLRFLERYVLHSVAFQRNQSGSYELQPRKNTTYQWLQELVGGYAPGFWRQHFSTKGATEEIRKLREMVHRNTANLDDNISGQDMREIAIMFEPNPGTVRETERILGKIILEGVIKPDIVKMGYSPAQQENVTMSSASDARGGARSGL